MQRASENGHYPAPLATPGRRTSIEAVSSWPCSKIHPFNLSALRPARGRSTPGAGNSHNGAYRIRGRTYSPWQTSKRKIRRRPTRIVTVALAKQGGPHHLGAAAEPLWSAMREVPEDQSGPNSYWLSWTATTGRPYRSCSIIIRACTAVSQRSSFARPMTAGLDGLSASRGSHLDFALASAERDVGRTI